MIKCLINKKMHREVEKHNKKLLMYTGIGAIGVGVGVYLTCRAIKKNNCSKELKEFDYLNDMQKENEDRYQKVKEDVYEDKELKEKIEEFNSNRITSDNEQHAQKGEIEKITENIKEDKKNIEIKEYLDVEDKYEEYEK